MTVGITLLLLAVCFVAIEAEFEPCNGPDCVQHVSITAKCTESPVRQPTRDCRWASNRSRRLDQEILGVTIYAFKLQWFNGHWSGWYIPGENELDLKFNRWPRRCYPPKYNYRARSLRRMWAYFYDHTHKFIYCGTLGQNTGNANLQHSLKLQESISKTQESDQRTP